MRNPGDISILIACEESQAVCKAFRARGFRAFSCDVIDQSGGHPEWHIQRDVRAVLKGKCHFKTKDRKRHGVGEWDLVIAFPPCTDLCSSGARWFPRKIADGTQEKSIEFFMMFTKLNTLYAIENPVGIMSTRYRKPDQIIQPWMFGHGEQKATCIWHHPALPDLKPTNVVDGREQRVWKMPPSATRAKERSKTRPGIAEAMASQWGDVLLKEDIDEDEENRAAVRTAEMAHV